MPPNRVRDRRSRRESDTFSFTARESGFCGGFAVHSADHCFINSHSSRHDSRLEGAETHYGVHLSLWHSQLRVTAVFERLFRLNHRLFFKHFVGRTGFKVLETQESSSRGYWSADFFRFIQDFQTGFGDPLLFQALLPNRVVESVPNELFPGSLYLGAEASCAGSAHALLCRLHAAPHRKLRGPGGGSRAW